MKQSLFKFSYYFALSIIAWSIVDLFIIKITLLQFIFIEIVIAFCQEIVKFIDKKEGESNNKSLNKKANSESEVIDSPM